MRGKYADRARSKRDADARYAAAVAEGNRLRSQIQELRHLRDDNASLRQRIEQLQHDVTTGSSSRVRELEDALADARAELHLHRTAHTQLWNDISDGLFDLIRAIPAQHQSPAWWTAVGGLLTKFVSFVDRERIAKFPPEIQNILGAKLVQGAFKDLHSGSKRRAPRELV